MQRLLASCPAQQTATFAPDHASTTSRAHQPGNGASHIAERMADCASGTAGQQQQQQQHHQAEPRSGPPMSDIGARSGAALHATSVSAAATQQRAVQYTVEEPESPETAVQPRDTTSAHTSPVREHRTPAAREDLLPAAEQQGAASTVTRRLRTQERDGAQLRVQEVYQAVDAQGNLHSRCTSRSGCPGCLRACISTCLD